MQEGPVVIKETKKYFSCEKCKYAQLAQDGWQDFVKVCSHHSCYSDLLGHHKPLVNYPKTPSFCPFVEEKDKRSCLPC